jgi:ankyrin repeat protein
MLATPATGPHDGRFIGHAIGFKNSTLGFDLFGSPHEILGHLHQRGISPQTAARHIETEITAQRVTKDPGQFRFSGGADVPEFTQLLESLSNADIAAAERLIAKEPSLIQSSTHRTANLLGHLAAIGRTQWLEMFLAAGAIVGSQGGLGMTALHWAGATGQAECAKVLLSHGADRLARNWFLLTPAELAAENAQERLVRLLNGLFRRARPVSLADVLERMGCATA